MRAVKEENSPNYNDLKQLEGTSVGDLKAECHRSKIYILPDEQVHMSDILHCAVTWVNLSDI
jgi:hypothetical protein